VPCQGGALELLDGRRGSPTDLLVQGTRVIWGVTEGSDSWTLRVPVGAPAGTDPDLLMSHTGGPVRLAANRHAVYATDKEDECIYKLPVGATEPVVHTPVLGRVDGFCADDDALYWTDYVGGLWTCPA